MSAEGNGHAPGTALAEPTTRAELTIPSEKLELIKRTVLKPSKRTATDDELALLAHQAQRTGLDPLARQIYGIYRWDSRVGGEVMTIQTSIDGFRLIAERTGRYLGQTPVYWADEDLAWHEVWTKDTPPIAAKVGVYKAGAAEPTWCVAKWTSYAVKNRNGGFGGLWGKMPDLMLGKCAEALALRKAFPAELSGLYTSDEMAQADVQVAPSPAPRPEAPKQAARSKQPVEPDRPRGTITDEQIVEIVEGFKHLGANNGQIIMLFGSVGAEAQRINRADSIAKALRAMSTEQGDEMIVLIQRELDAKAEQG